MFRPALCALLLGTLACQTLLDLEPAAGSGAAGADAGTAAADATAPADSAADDAEAASTADGMPADALLGDAPSPDSAGPCAVTTQTLFTDSFDNGPLTGWEGTAALGAATAAVSTNASKSAPSSLLFSSPTPGSETWVTKRFLAPEKCLYRGGLKISFDIMFDTGANFLATEVRFYDAQYVTLGSTQLFVSPGLWTLGFNFSGGLSGSGNTPSLAGWQRIGLVYRFSTNDAPQVMSLEGADKITATGAFSPPAIIEVEPGVRQSSPGATSFYIDNVRMELVP